MKSINTVLSLKRFAISVSLATLATLILQGEAQARRIEQCAPPNTRAPSQCVPGTWRPVYISNSQGHGQATCGPKYSWRLFTCDSAQEPFLELRDSQGGSSASSKNGTGKGTGGKSTAGAGSGSHKAAKSSKSKNVADRGQGRGDSKSSDKSTRSEKSSAFSIHDSQQTTEKAGGNPSATPQPPGSDQQHTTNGVPSATPPAPGTSGLTPALYDANGNPVLYTKGGAGTPGNGQANPTGGQGEAPVSPAIASEVKEAQDNYDEDKERLNRQQAAADSYQTKTTNEAGSHRATGDDPCKVSSTLDGDMTCGGTKSWVKNSAMTNAITQGLGSQVVNGVGMAVQQKASQSGSTADTYEATAKTQKMTAYMNMTLGAVNGTLGGVQLWKGGTHADNADKLQKAMGQTDALYAARQAGGKNNQGLASGDHGYLSADSKLEGDQKKYADAIFTAKRFRDLNKNVELRAVTATKDVVKFTEEQKEWKKKADAARSTNPQLAAQYDNLATTAGRRLRQAEALEKQQLEQRDSDLEQRKSRTDEAVAGIREDAKSEQKVVADEAKAGGWQSLMVGGQQLLGAMFTLKAAKEMEEAAKKMREAEKMGAPAVGAPDFNNTGGLMTSRAPTTISGDGTSPATAPAEEDPGKEENGDLGDGLNLDTPPGDPLAKNPEADPFKAKEGGGGGGGGNSNISPGSVTAAGTGEPEATAKMLDNKGGGNYETAGGTGGYTAAGGGSGGGGSGGGPDLSKLGEMFAQFMPKEGDVDQNGIMNFGRNPASVGDADISRTGDLFGNVARRYRAKVESGFGR